MITVFYHKEHGFLFSFNPGNVNQIPQQKPHNVHMHKGKPIYIFAISWMQSFERNVKEKWCFNSPTAAYFRPITTKTFLAGRLASLTKSNFPDQINIIKGILPILFAIPSCRKQQAGMRGNWMEMEPEQGGNEKKLQWNHSQRSEDWLILLPRLSHSFPRNGVSVCCQFFMRIVLFIKCSRQNEITAVIWFDVEWWWWCNNSWLDHFSANAAFLSETLCRREGEQFLNLPTVGWLCIHFRNLISLSLNWWVVHV